VATKEAFQEKIRQLGILVGELEALPGSGSNVAARELVQLLMEVHGAALERVMEIVNESGAPGEAIIARAAQDPFVRPLLLLYSLHPDDVETRILKGLEVAAPRLRKHSSQVELVSLSGGEVRVKIHTEGHACGSTGKTVHSIVEECLFDHAPDLTSLEILADQEAPSSGFVSLDSLMKQPLPPHVMAPAAELCGAD
jgi:Fe-S cluster biogenesis protein NfuA